MLAMTPALVLALGVASLFALPAQVSQVQTPPTPSPAAQPPCVTASDEKYAYTREHPVQVGGSPVYGAARQRRYLDALRGPQGQVVRYKRTGSSPAPDGTILDGYEVTYDGLEKAVTLFLDWYHYQSPRAPRGFTCGRPIGLGLPPVAPFQEMDDVRAVAFGQGATRDFPPIPLGPDGATTHGVVFDRFRVFALAARAAAAKGVTLDPAKPPRELAQQGMVVLAYTLTCDRTVRPAAVDIVAADGSAMPRTAQKEVTGADLARLLPGVQVPAGSLAITLPLSAPRPNDTIRITYAEAACGSTATDVALPVAFTPARGLEMPQPILPEGMPEEGPVFLQGLIDTEGLLRRATYVGGPKPLVGAATEAIGRWRLEPARINGAPVPTGAVLQVRFTRSPQL